MTVFGVCVCMYACACEVCACELNLNIFVKISVVHSLLLEDLLDLFRGDRCVYLVKYIHAGVMWQRSE